VALLVYLTITDTWWWALGFLVVPALAAQAWIRTKEYAVASESLWALRQRAGMTPESTEDLDRERVR
jgi:hypothetical protein